MKQDAREKIEQTERFILIVWTVFLIILYVCSFLSEYRFPIKQEEMVIGARILIDLQKLFFFALMGLGFLIDLVRMKKDKNIEANLTTCKVYCSQVTIQIDKAKLYN